MKKVIAIFTILFLTCGIVFANSDEAAIREVLRNHQKAVKSQDINLIKTFYDKDYYCSDGFKLDELLSMLRKTYKSYDDIKYQTKIYSVDVYGNWAVARMEDKTTAYVYLDEKKQDKNLAGLLDSKSSYSVYLKNDDGKWKIFYDDVLMEETSLKYGYAKKIKMMLDTPAFINNGEEYNLSLNIEKPATVIALASVANEEIKYPTPDLKEKFRKYPAEGELQRIVKANSNNLDEYAIASVGLTRVLMNEDETKARIEIVGAAYLMKRVAMLSKKTAL